ncbi:MAG: Gfo/Idh/MocA family oxidoreductase [Flavobacteriaceae bacterium]|jgi:UDP-N-acetyl-2-amino-2-deoxyglucuronate dehydrogenase|nr:Gfo/Idh/MocA family oxidoreductase [Flavobacteriaceae bacterium]MBT6169117.1 Gfo/Idh/MocA family oxidoreductase [Flavobacteriaceae bacterium]MBT6447791.1 Gfo/Idh/MocA family oxidoreductase [Flavobacteriaceae bacterium]
MKNFTLIGASGYVAPRHMKAIKETGNNLLASVDISDSVGIIDNYFPDSSFFTSFERFDRHVEKLKYENNIKIDYVSICSPNHLHDSHIRYALRSGADAICEKPLVVSLKNLDNLLKIENTLSNKVYTILQLREHPSIIELKNKIDKSKNDFYNIDLSYITSRGKWYDYSWKGDITKSGGIATNIGVHFFDMLIWIFGKPESVTVHRNRNNVCSGLLRLKKANVKWFLSTDSKFLPKNIIEKDQRTYRSITINNKELEFSSGFENLHTKVYNGILEKRGFGIENAYDSIKLVDNIRFMKESALKDDYHIFNKKVK